MPLSIIIINYNTKNLLINCLNSIFNNHRDDLREIIIVDNASTDGSPEFIKNNFANVVLIENKNNVGFGRANNQGAKIAQGEILFFLNPDTIIKDNIFRKFVDTFDSDQKIGIVAPQLILPDGSSQPWAYGKEQGIWQLIKSKLSKSSVQYPVSSVNWVSGAALAIRRDIFEKVGGFDEKFFMYFEDQDLCRRVRDLGYKVVVLSDAEVIHFGGKSLREGKEQKRLYYQSQNYYWRKHFGRFKSILMRFIRWPYYNLNFNNDESRRDTIEPKLIRQKFQNEVRLIEMCGSLKNKFFLILRLVLKIIFYPLYKLTNCRYFLVPIFLWTDLVVENEDGRFYCRKWTEDINIIAPTFECGLRKYFELETGVFVDVGAHIGKYTIMMAKKLKNSKSKVIAIEPDPDTFKILKKNLELNKLDNVIAINVAAFSENGTINFYKEKRFTGASGAKPFVPIGNTTNLRILNRPMIRIKAKKLDNIFRELNINEVNFMKIDVEGLEKEVLKGAIDTLRNSHKMKIIFETWNDKYLEECRAILVENGFDIQKLNAKNYLAVKSIII